MSDEHFTVDGTLLEAWPATRVSEERTGQGKLCPDREVSGLSRGEAYEVSQRKRKRVRAVVSMVDERW